MLVGVISDTHGRMDPRVFAQFQDVEHILHAGDIGAESVLAGLQALAPVDAVRGNNDRTGVVATYPLSRVAHVAGLRLLVRHEVRVPGRPDDPLLVACRAGEIDAVIFGHSHRPFCERKGDILFFNPGSAGPRRFRSIPSVGLLRLTEQGISAEIVAL